MEDRMDSFLDSLQKGNSSQLDELEVVAKQTNVPIIRPQMQNLLRFLLKQQRPQKILEVGTAIGFSALLMAENTSETTTIETIEKYDKRIQDAKVNFERSPYSHRIVLLEGDAQEILSELKGPYDFIFMDAAKGQYIHYLSDVLRVLAPGGLLVSDNILQEGELIESRFTVTRRNRTIHSRMREYLYEITHHPLLESVVLPVADGVTLSIKIETE